MDSAGTLNLPHGLDWSPGAVLTPTLILYGSLSFADVLRDAPPSAQSILMDVKEDLVCIVDDVKGCLVAAQRVNKSSHCG